VEYPLAYFEREEGIESGFLKILKTTVLE